MDLSCHRGDRMLTYSTGTYGAGRWLRAAGLCIAVGLAASVGWTQSPAKRRSSGTAASASHGHTPAAAQSMAGAEYVGSQACERCHAADYKGWKQTRMANVVRDPKVHPEAVLGDFAHPD